MTPFIQKWPFMLLQNQNLIKDFVGTLNFSSKKCVQSIFLYENNSLTNWERNNNTGIKKLNDNVNNKKDILFTL